MAANTELRAHEWHRHAHTEVTMALDTDFEPPARLLYAKAAGAVSIDLPGGGTVVVTLAAGDFLDKFAIKQVNTSGTTIATPLTNVQVFR